MHISLKTQKKIMPLLFLIPGMAFFLIFQVYPLLQGFQMSFFNWQIMPGKVSEFIGLDNYIRAFNDPIFGRAFKNTLIYAVVTVPAQMALAMAAAVLLNALPKGKVLFRVLYYLPVITSWVIVSILIRYMFQSPQGLVNYYGRGAASLQRTAALAARCQPGVCANSDSGCLERNWLVHGDLLSGVGRHS